MSGRVAMQGAAIALLAALAARMILLPRMALLQADGCTYVWLAQDMLAGRVVEALQHPFHPLYPALMAALGRVGVPLETAGYALSIALGALSAPLLFLAFARAMGPASALAGALLFAASPYAVRAGADVMSEATFFFFIAAGLVAGARALSPAGDACGMRLSSAALAGFFSGCAYLARPEGLVLTIALAAMFFGRAILSSGARGRSAAACALVVAGTAMAAGPYIAWISGDAGELRLTRKKSFAGLIDDLTGAEILSRPHVTVDPASGPALPPSPGDIRWLAEHAGDLPRSSPASPVPAGIGGRVDATLEVLSRFIDTAHPLIFILAIASLIGRIATSLRRDDPPGERGAAWLIGLVASGLFLAALLNRIGAGYAHKRHLLAAACLVAAPAGRGAVLLARAGAARYGHPRTVASILLIACAAILLPKALAGQFSERRGLLDVSATLRARDPARFATERPAVLGYAATEIAYYAGGREVDLPGGPASAVLAEAGRRGLRYIAISLRGGDGEPSPAAITSLADAGVKPFYDRAETIEGHVVRRVLYDLEEPRSH